jgi:hypothetical protein
MCVYVYIYIICIYQLDFRDTYPPFWTKRDKPIARLVAEDVELDPRSFDMIIRLCNRQGWLRWETLWLGWLRWMGQLGPGKMWALNIEFMWIHASKLNSCVSSSNPLLFFDVRILRHLALIGRLETRSFVRRWDQVTKRCGSRWTDWADGNVWIKGIKGWTGGPQKFFSMSHGHMVGSWSCRCLMIFAAFCCARKIPRAWLCLITSFEKDPLQGLQHVATWIARRHWCRRWQKN